ncbi:hypothetical protein O181_084219 [Austropuccinia psidii MF-1]|uniref:Uncharacterized protein n=1 Tax=Austropuccinia psidii MF-1 TaxID=1389203 RepID=A0A9Q3FT19_9BASI|nr:hypothetical protein [Austropuccinia psidii MF-1]
MFPNFLESSRRGCCNSFSQTSSNTFSTTRQDRTFMNNMNSNMQGMLTPLMMILQQGQDQAEEQDRIQQERDEEREMLQTKREEER